MLIPFKYVQITSSNPTGNLLNTFKDIKARKNTDTVWNTFQLSDTGSITLQGIAYLCGNKVSGAITIKVFHGLRTIRRNF